MANAAIWGSGFIAGSHVEALRSANVNILAVVSRSLEGSRKFAQKWGIERWSDDESILFAPEIDCVHAHARQERHLRKAPLL